MPIYEYKCNRCGAVSEILHKTTAVKTVNCTHCDSTDLTKLISAPGAVMTKHSHAHSHAEAPPACPNRDRCGAACPGGFA